MECNSAANTNSYNSNISAGHGGRRRYYNKKNKKGNRYNRNNNQDNFGYREPKFEGRCSALKGFIYDCFPGKIYANQYARTTQEIQKYVSGKGNFKRGLEFALVIERLEKPTLTKPSGLGENPTLLEKTMWELDIEYYVEDKRILENNLLRLYCLVQDQCSDLMQVRVWSHPKDGIELLKIVRSVAYGFEHNKYLPLAIHEANRRLYSFRQGNNMSDATYREQFQNQVEVLEYNGATLFDYAPHGVIQFMAQEQVIDLATVSDSERQTFLQNAKKKYLEIALLSGSNPNRNGELRKKFEILYA